MVNDLCYRFLKESDRSQLHRALQDAFADYYHDMSYLTEERWLNRLAKNGYCHELSAGLFMKDRMVGFTYTGAGIYNGLRSAHDTGTGIVKEYRGSGHATRIFEMIRERLLEKGYQQFVLEVLQENDKAIKTYQKAGFRIERELKCLQINVQDYKPEQIKGVDVVNWSRSEIDEFRESVNRPLSWETSFDAIGRIQDELDVRCALVDGERAGVLVYYPGLKWIVTLIVKNEFRKLGVGTSLLNRLFEEQKPDKESIKIINIDGEDEETISFFKFKGFTDYADQYEMLLDLRGQAK